MEMALNVPALRRNGVDHRYAKVLLKRLDDIEGAPGGTQHVDRLRPAVHEKDLFDEAIDFHCRKLLHLVEVDVHSSHVEHLEPDVDEVFRVDFIDVSAEIGGADEALDLERAQSIERRGAGREDRP